MPSLPAHRYLLPPATHSFLPHASTSLTRLGEEEGFGIFNRAEHSSPVAGTAVLFIILSSFIITYLIWSSCLPLRMTYWLANTRHSPAAAHYAAACLCRTILSAARASTTQTLGFAALPHLAIHTHTRHTTPLLHYGVDTCLAWLPSAETLHFPTPLLAPAPRCTRMRCLTSTFATAHDRRAGGDCLPYAPWDAPRAYAPSCLPRLHVSVWAGSAARELPHWDLPAHFSGMPTPATALPGIHAPLHRRLST